MCVFAVFLKDWLQVCIVSVRARKTCLKLTDFHMSCFITIKSLILSLLFLDTARYRFRHSYGKKVSG